ncbi:sensor histidine kinase [Luteibaculum oceani]|uniref:histidine kinase n=1 Tax=Luteibaculum oceani TaxID=1294296 RepID=A0A5C6VID5_9FLAO|nr:ATP-binding protein [Luteibaculum oceani]TXC85292.1 hypothetical protein FRX97_01320 [Luteibaculum oceani]
MPKSKQILLFPIAISILWMAFYLGILGTQNNQQPKDLSNLLEQEITSGYLIINNGRISSWSGNFIPTDIANYKTGFAETSNGLFFLYPPVASDQNGVKIPFLTLSRNFTVSNRHTEQIKHDTPYYRASLESFPYSKPLTFNNQTVYVQEINNNQVNHTWIFLCSLLLIIAKIILAKCFRNDILLFLFLILNWIVYARCIPDYLLENAGYFFQPISYASSSWFTSIADVWYALFLMCLLIRYSINKWSTKFIACAIAITVPLAFPSLIKDGELFPEVNIPVVIAQEGVNFWITILLLALIFYLIVKKLRGLQSTPRTNRVFVVVTTMLTTVINDYYGFVDMLHVLWTILALIAVLYIPKQGWATAAYIIILGLGMGYSSTKYAQKKLDNKGQVASEYLSQYNETPLSWYLLQEEWKRKKHLAKTLENETDCESFLRSEILVAYLDKYEPVKAPNKGVDGPFLSGDSIFISLPSCTYWLEDQSSFTRTGFPDLLADESWQLNLDNRFSFASYNNNILEDCSPYYNPPTVIDKLALERFKGKMESSDHKFLVNRYQSRTTFVSYPKAITTLVQLALSIFLILFFINFIGNFILSKSQTKLAQRIGYSLIAICVITSLLIGYLGYQNLTRQFDDENRTALLQQAQVAKQAFNQRPEWRSKILAGNNIKLENWLTKIAQEHKTDYTLYNTQGALIASSEPLLYKEGFRSSLLNFNTLKTVIEEQRIVIQDEIIGELDYKNAYVPLYGKGKVLIAILNIPLFEQQQILEKELQGYSASYLNTLLITLTLALLIGQILSSRVTRSFTWVENALMNQNSTDELTTLHYDKSDEIGSLVEAYNQKVSRINTLLDKIAEKEREGAWREMAKQVAHEIKNPLTPLKLKAQWLQMKLSQLEQNEAKLKTEELIVTVLDQTELLKNIANEFSNYASLEKSNPEIIALKPEMEKIAALYSESMDVIIDLEIPDHLQVYQDRNHFKRIYSNLFKNAIQAKREDQNSIIKIVAKEIDNEISISITDNGVGISAELIQRIFEPNFTTKTSGMGLGLAMVKNMLNMVDAKISVISTPNKGSKFTITYTNNHIDGIQ